jgi:TPR repeat protein
MLGSLYAVGRSVHRNAERAATLYQKSCTAGFLRGCGSLGDAYISGDGVPRDMNKARQIFEDACRQGFQAACKALEQTASLIK